MAKKSTGEKKETGPNYELVKSDSADGKEAYQVLSDMLSAHHGEIIDLKIILLWRMNVKADPDGRVVLGRCRILGERDREAFEVDVQIELNAEWWKKATEAKRRALMDHELCHIALVSDQDGQKFDKKGRPLLRSRKHEITEFLSVLQHHGADNCLPEMHVQVIRQLMLPFDKKRAEDGEKKGKSKDAAA